MPNPYTGTDNDPFQEAQHRFTGPEWERFFGSLKGKNVRFVGGPPVAGGTGELRPGDLDTARSNATNAYLNQLTDQGRGEAQQLRQMTAGADIAEAQARGVAGQERDQAAVDTAMATGGQPAAPIGQNPDGSYTTMRQAGPPPTVQEQRANVLKMLPGHLQPVYQAQWAKQDQAAAAQTEQTRHNTALEEAAAAKAAPSSDVADTVAGMKDGTLPPQLPGRASKEYVAILGEAKRQGYDLAGAATDWQATQKHIATMNGAQQLRLNQAVNALPDMLDNVDTLASQWKGGKFPVLNKANLALAKGGAFGKDAASIANQLDAQIADVTADLGNVYMGGNSPTDHALKLAGKSLSAEWDEKVLHDMVTMAKKNVQIRQNSIKNTGVAGASAANPYGNQTPAAAPSGAVEEWGRDASGKLVKKGKG